MYFATKDKNLETVFTTVQYSSNTTLKNFVSYLTKYQIENYFFHDIDTLEDIQKLYQTWKVTNPLSTKQNEMLMFLEKSNWLK